MSVTHAPSPRAAAPAAPDRRRIFHGRGRSHGKITRLMSPGDLGTVLKPFVFLDLFDNQGDRFPTFGLHPHSGLATLTYVAEGSVSYEDTNGATGILREGGVEWMRAGKGVWHAGGAGDPGRTRGFQLWIALPPLLELGGSESLYQGASEIPQVGPVRVLLGEYAGVANAIAPPSDMTYLAVSLQAGETWRYDPPAGHEVLWLAMGKGAVTAPDLLEHGDIVIFDRTAGGVSFTAKSDAEFVIGSAAPHPHDLALGYYSVHTSPEALAAGEAHIAQIRERLVAQGRL
ncbi:pirin family protein [Phenylobacterium sp.]|uniref:pirin family protein n=1 Tax=Phenylobacterium sp. TaxID=1871053 RepID=UPI002B882FBB|nr:pirin family protein [Phenylobacterium sp.]HLZ74777.1 pirin family protein [Phenylobacterium sp.]